MCVAPTWPCSICARVRAARLLSSGPGGDAAVGALRTHGCPPPSPGTPARRPLGGIRPGPSPRVVCRAAGSTEVTLRARGRPQVRAAGCHAFQVGTHVVWQALLRSWEVKDSSENGEIRPVGAGLCDRKPPVPWGRPLSWRWIAIESLRWS